MTDLVLHAIARKHNAEFGAASSIFNMADGSVVTVTITIPNGVVMYLLRHGGYANQADVLAEFSDAQGSLLWDWEEYPDTSFNTEQIPLTQKAFKNNIKTVFTNTSGNTATILLKIEVLLVPEFEMAGFEADILKLVPE